MRKLFFLSILVILGTSSRGQEKKSLYQFRTLHHIVLVNGSNSVSAALQSIAGVSRGPWFLGAGAGLDYYICLTVFVFIDTRFECGKTKNKYFIYADGGINFSWLEEDLNGNPGIWGEHQYRDGIYTDAGFGYLFGMKNKDALIISLGYSHKKLKETITYEDWRTREPLIELHSYGLNRVMIKVGWRL